MAADGVDDEALNTMEKMLINEGATVKIIAPRNGSLKTSRGDEVKVDGIWLTTKKHKYTMKEVEAIEFVNEALKHCKAIAAVVMVLILSKIKLLLVKLQKRKL